MDGCNDDRETGPGAMTTGRLGQEQELDTILSHDEPDTSLSHDEPDTSLRAVDTSLRAVDTSLRAVRAHQS